KYEHTNFSILNKVAETSFAIYFLHPFLLNAAFSLLTKLNFNYQGNFLIWIFVAFTTVITSMALAVGIKAVLKKRSRYLIGW
ncbi:MAG: acyltransferase family protein, partial [Cyanobacteria bacterium J06633_23]